jgi:hypothetical protein
VPSFRGVVSGSIPLPPARDCLGRYSGSLMTIAAAAIVDVPVVAMSRARSAAD